ncbi:Serine/threonine-protein phosphatase 2B catalytic subunit [Zancudomyces culisetae]|uniref:Serine/threonine-protein phosphatase 2B catalytic subunit n=1 Tax=Zancudomyces culisetae TaxID=1213189 RepID=A0A1R1PNJ9_ZANCU|nr:Serine/threonine-protein phosphatase 2B catalytic subunit [Zancudomyces culisetae]|eukprot:OMH82546.1 Serine/threonine-protein phosphatase 2B catalytic subunit [Zancudomyces culisetae]
MFGRLNDLVWSDPSPTYNSKMLVGNERHISERDFEPNTMRACSYYYSHYAAFNFLKKNKLKFMVRGHQILKTGYKLHRKTKEGHHSIISLFSAPNFLDVFGNEGAFLFYKDNEVNLKTFTAVSTKTYWLPGFMDGFTWSLPYIGEKVTEFLSAILNVCSPEEVEKGMISLSVDGNDLESTTDFDKSGKSDGTHATSSEEESDSQASEGDAEDPSERPSSRKAVNKVRRENMRKKIFALGKFTKMFVSIREDRENMGELRELIENTRARSFNLTTGVATLNHSATSFEDALRWNRKNEMMPAKRDGQSYLENLNGPHEPEEDYEERDYFTESSKSDGGSGSDTASTLG